MRRGDPEGTPCGPASSGSSATGCAQPACRGVCLDPFSRVPPIGGIPRQSRRSNAHPNTSRADRWSVKPSFRRLGPLWICRSPDRSCERAGRSRLRRDGILPSAAATFAHPGSSRPECNSRQGPTWSGLDHRRQNPIAACQNRFPAGVPCLARRWRIALGVLLLAVDCAGARPRAVREEASQRNSS